MVQCSTEEFKEVAPQQLFQSTINFNNKIKVNNKKIILMSS